MSVLKDDQVEIYTWGLVHCSVCAPVDMDHEDIELRVNGLLPTGLDHGWYVSDDEKFAGGQLNGVECDMDTGRQHWLMSC